MEFVKFVNNQRKSQVTWNISYLHNLIVIMGLQTDQPKWYIGWLILGSKCLKNIKRFKYTWFT